MIKKTAAEIKQDKMVKFFYKSKKKKVFIKKDKKPKVKKQKEKTPKRNYYAELKSPEWKKRRAEILEIDNHKCIYCGSKTKLVIHHTKYIEGRKAWEYPDQYLITLCDLCHKSIHYIM